MIKNLTDGEEEDIILKLYEENCDFISCNDY